MANDYTAQIATMRRENPSAFPDDESAQQWGQKYYGWGASPAPAQAGSPETPNSPVDGGGLVPNAPASTAPLAPSPTAPAASPTAAPASQPTFADPFAAQGGGVWIGEGWVPKDHPLAAQYQSAHPAGAATPGAPVGTTAAGVQPPADITPGSSTTIAGGAGTGGITTDGSGRTTGVAPSVGLGNTNNGTPLNSQLRSDIMGLLKQDVNGASINDADLRPQADAYSAERERQRRQQQAAIMERLNGAGAASSGAADLATKQGFETAGQDTASFNASLVGQKLQQRQQMLTTAIQAASQLGMQEEANNLSRQLANLNAQMSTMQLAQGAQGQALQAKVANMDAQTKTYLSQLDADLRREGYSSAERMARMDTELRRYGIDVQGNLGMLNAIVNLIGIGTQNTQFYDNLGFQGGLAEAGLNNGLISSLLGG